MSLNFLSRVQTFYPFLHRIKKRSNIRRLGKSGSESKVLEFIRKLMKRAADAAWERRDNELDRKSRFLVSECARRESYAPR